MGSIIQVDSTSTWNTTANAALTCNYPTLSASGDLLVMFVATQRNTTSGTQSIDTPSGWTLLDTNNQSSGVGEVAATFWRFRGAETSVSTNITTSAAGLQFTTIQIHAYRGDIDATTPIDASDIAYSSVTGSSAARTAPTVTTTLNNAWVSTFIFAEKTTTGTYAWTGTPAVEVIDSWTNSSADLIFSSASYIKRSAGSTGTHTVTPNGTTNESISATVAIRPGNTDIRPVFIDSLHSDGSTTASQAYNYPAWSQSGDLMLLFAHSRGGTAASTAAAPAGWTQIIANSQYPNTPGGSGSWVYWRFRGAETSVTHVIATPPSPIYQWGTVMAIDGASVDATTPIAAYNNAMNLTGNTTTLPVPAVTTTSSNIVLNSGMYDGGSLRTVTWDSSAFELNDTCVSASVFRGAADAVVLNPANATLTTNTATLSSASSTSVRYFFNAVAVQPVQNATVPTTDSGSASESATVRAFSTATDSGAGIEAAQIRIAATEIGTASESATVTAAIPGTDTGSATESASVRASVPVLDSGSFAESAYVTNVAIVTETATGTETAYVTVYASDYGSFVDFAVGIGQDLGSFTETAKVNLAVTDSGTAVESAYSSQLLGSGDAGSATDTAKVGQTVTDAGSFTESVSTTAAVPVTDSGSATESARVIIYVTDSGTAVDTARIGQTVADAASAVESASLHVTVFATDSGSAVEATSGGAYVTDSGHFLESAFKLVSGLLQFPRMVKVPKDDRRIIIEREPRRVMVEPDYRTYNIRPEVRRHYAIAPDKRVFKIDAEE